jgi:hypothetical protein
VADPRIFISMGTPYAPKYTAFRLEIERFIREECKSDPRIIGVNEYPPGNPLDKIRDVMRSCHGVLIVAYERKFIDRGMEKRTGSTPTALEQRTYTTTWNHIESALAYSLGLPIYFICENGLTEEGLIETKLDWYVQRIDFDPAELRNPHVTQSIRAWVDERVRPRARRMRVAQTFEGTIRLSEMTPKEIWTTLAVLSAVFLAGAALGRWLPAWLAGA